MEKITDVKAYKISKLNLHIKTNMDQKYKNQKIWIVGEISNLSKPNGATVYFKLKDEDAELEARIYTNVFESVGFLPENGMQVFVQGEVTFYEKTGRISFLAEKMQEQGVGDLHKKFEKTKKKLQAEGLFDVHHKKRIPEYPKRIGVVTSRTGAVIGDIERTLKRRYPMAEIQLFPAIVQGAKAAESVARGIREFNRRGQVDVLIVGRGGGSLEELWAFNEEKVVRAIFDSVIPVIAAVGHDSDVTLANFVADLAASTPTAAAEMATPHSKDQLENKIRNQMRTIFQFGARSVREREIKVGSQKRSVQLMHPKNKVEKMANTHNVLEEKMKTLMNEEWAVKKEVWEKNRQRLDPKSLQNMIGSKAVEMERKRERLKTQVEKKYKNKEMRFTEKLIELDTLSPLKTMARGYSLVYKENQIIKDASKLNKGDKVIIKVQKGQVHASVEKVEKEKGDRKNA